MPEWSEELKNKLQQLGVFPKQEIMKKADSLYAVLKDNSLKTGVSKKIIAIYGGSGSGKTSIGTALACLFEQEGKKCYVLHGDNYPLRIPRYNDAERLSIFRESGLRMLVKKGIYTKEAKEQLQRLQKEDRDCDIREANNFPWLAEYISGGRKGLCGYLGTSKELEFAVLNQVMESFHNNDKEIWIRSMGRTPDSITYENVDVSETDILILEWTHGYSEKLLEIDYQIYLRSTPEETLADRIKRNRDSNTDSPFVSIVLEIEQNLIEQGGKQADIIMEKNGKIHQRKEF